jgi:hypothetical protein
VDNRDGELSVTYGEIASYGWSDVDKFIMPRANPGTEGQKSYLLKVARLLCDSLNTNKVTPFYDPEP